jgi:SAM-dependent methyltransferase
MDQLTEGLHSVLSFADVYDFFQRLLGASRLRERFIAEFVAPFAGAKLLDIGCGTASLLEYLPADVEYVGFDLNPNYITSARKKYYGRGTFFCGRVSEVAVDDSFDFVLGAAILHHLSDAEARKLFATAYSCLKRGGALVTFDPVFVKEQSAFARYIISKDRGKRVRTPEQYAALASAFFVDVEKHVLHDLLRIPYTHFIMRCSKY